MKKIVSTLLVAMLCFVLGATAQTTRTVSGKVTDEKGDAIPFASVVVKGGSRSGASADAFGVFSVKVKRGDVIEISAVGFQTTSITYADQNSLGISLKTGDNTLLKEVVITSAFETKRSARSTSASAPTISGDQLNTVRTLNVNNALAGKVPGVQVRSQATGKLGQDNAIRLRGENSLGSSSGAIYVVNGTIVASAQDINPDDIESISVLQGPSASALFGTQGGNGAIVITTKKAKRNERGIGVTVNSASSFESVARLPEYQNSYAGGSSPTMATFNYNAATMPSYWAPLAGKQYHDYTTDESWGPAITGQEYIPWYAWYPGTQYTGKTASLTPQPNNIREFYKTAANLNNNVVFSKATEGVSTRISYSNINQTGLVPNTRLNKNTLTTSTSVDLNSHFVMNLNLNYVTQTVFGDFSDGYGNNVTGSFNSWFHRDLEMSKLIELSEIRDPYGNIGSWNKPNPTSYGTTLASQQNFFKANYWYNSFTYQKYLNNRSRKDRLYGDFSVTYKINNDLSVRALYRKNQNTTYVENITPSILQSSGYQTGLAASYSTSNSFSNQEHWEGLVTYNKRFNDFSVSGNTGFDFYNAYQNGVNAATAGGLNVENLYSLQNSKNAITYGNTRSAEKFRALFVTANVGYKNLLFIDGTIRKDYSSTLPSANNSILSKSVGASFVFSDLLKTSVPWLNFGKLRASWGEIPQTLDPYQYPGFNYPLNANQYNGNFIMNTPDQVVDSSIKGSVNTAKEIGLDLRFWKNKLGLTFTYWDQTNKGFPLSAQTYAGTGFTSKLINAGEVRKNGIDITLNLRPLSSNDFQWEITGAFGKIIKNEIVSLSTDTTVKQITSSSPARFGVPGTGYLTPQMVHRVGMQWGQLMGNTEQTINGQPVLDANGFYVRNGTPQFLGSVIPEFTGGVQNTFSYKGFTLNVNIDFQKGGKFGSLSEAWMDYAGLSAATGALNDKGKSVRDAVASGGGVHVFGVDNTGKPVDYYVDGHDYFKQFADVSGIQFSKYVHDLSFIKLRELALSYDFNVKKLGLGKAIQSARLSFITNNLWLIYANTKAFDPSEINSTYGDSGGQYPSTRSYGINLRVGF
ncbi:SusC/RagA family TonB-linked outer membrane protein [Sediminibacterium roseum]|uniref:SusC/RagA family TonB-linked outer membrane protein n=1 Tax=Sediminibacterium roseum TaxID=1978412 RepID=A0ABX0A272_9BACT|nr:SusC/RagA family TonB-linked outer membrane protein [Sediminibacterium roseum]NCI51518.1 SusC/RagA family TonB-linked outer membrane protein [Sediminibacterium roseum]